MREQTRIRVQRHRAKALEDADTPEEVEEPKPGPVTYFVRARIGRIDGRLFVWLAHITASPQDEPAFIDAIHRSFSRKGEYTDMDIESISRLSA